MTESIQPETGSPAGQLNKAELIKVGKGALIAGLGALLAFVGQYLSGVDWGQWTFVSVALGAILVNWARLFFTDNTTGL